MIGLPSSVYSAITYRRIVPPGFGGQIGRWELPNKLLQEFVALAKGGELNLPLVEELAADILMDDFSPKFTQAAKHAAALIEGTLYARYYDVDCAVLRSLPESKPEPTRRSWFSRNRETPANPFAALCIRRAGADESKRWDVHEQPADFRARFAPALRGLVLANEGRSLDESTDARHFLGWTQKRHWLLSAETPNA